MGQPISVSAAEFKRLEELQSRQRGGTEAPAGKGETLSGRRDASGGKGETLCGGQAALLSDAEDFLRSERTKRAFQEGFSDALRPDAVTPLGFVVFLAGLLGFLLWLGNAWCASVH